MDAKKKATKQARTSGYKPIVHLWGNQPRDLPVFNAMYHVPMMMLEPTVRLALAMRAGPLCQAEFAYKEGEDWKPGIQAEDDMLGAFVERNMKRIWNNYIGGLLDAQKWGWAAAEVVLKQTSGGKVEVAELLHRGANDVRPITQNGRVAGVRFLRIEGAENSRVDLQFPYCLWHPFRPEAGQHFGWSICKGAFSPFWDKWMDGGALDVRRLFMHKDAYGGVDVSYPDGYTEIPISPGSSETTSVHNGNIAREMAEQIKAGGVTSRPSDTDQNGKEKWTITRASIPANPAHILTYPKDLDTEIYRGMEIPDDVLESTEGAGGAWAGKTVPQAAFYTGLELWLRGIILDIKTQIMDPLVRINFGRDMWYEITTKPLSLQATEQQGKDKTPQAAPQQFGSNPLAMSLEAIGRGLPAEPFVRGAKRRRVRMDASPKANPKSSGGNRWVTIGGRSKAGAGDHHGGFPVQIDKDGNVLKGGPKGLQGKHVSAIGKHFEESRESKSKEADDFFGGITKEREAAAKAGKEDEAARGAGNTRSLKKIVAYQAEAWGMSEETYTQFMDEIWEDESTRQQEREQVKRAAREGLGIDAGTLKRIENRGGGDYSNVKGLDEMAQELKEIYPHFFSSGNDEEDLWNLIIEGKQEPISKTSREFHAKVDEYLQGAMESAGSEYVPDEEIEAMQFALDKGGHDHKGKGEGGGQFTSKGGGDDSFTLNSKPKQGRTLDIPFPSKAKQKDLFAGRGDAPGQTSFFDDIDPGAKNVADQKTETPFHSLQKKHPELLKYAQTFDSIPKTKGGTVKHLNPRQEEIYSDLAKAKSAGEITKEEWLVGLAAIKEMDDNTNRIGTAAVKESQAKRRRVRMSFAEERERLLRMDTSPREDASHEFSSTQFNLPGDLAFEVRMLGERIAADDLTDDGRELNPHVTVKFGLHTDSADDVRAIVENLPPIAVQLGKASVFASEAYDVVKIEIQSKGLRELNAALSKLPNGDVHPEYKPHCTIAYVRSGLGEGYAARLNDLEGRVAVFDRLIFSDKNRAHTSIPLTGKPKRFALNGKHRRPASAIRR